MITEKAYVIRGTRLQSGEYSFSLYGFMFEELAFQLAGELQQMEEDHPVLPEHAVSVVITY